MRFHNITKDDMKNGAGLRAVLWVAGCAHACKGCHNPITWDVEGGIPFDQNAHDELFSLLDKPYTSGLTLSGGDPLHPQNRPDVTALVQEVRKAFPQKTIWLYTGYDWETISSLPLIQDVDVVVDGRFEEDKFDAKLHWRGSSNQRVIAVGPSLQENRVVLYCD